eukprot:Platyproteum_vivax@DN3657_c0_g1_i1.p1
MKVHCFHTALNGLNLWAANRHYCLRTGAPHGTASLHYLPNYEHRAEYEKSISFKKSEIDSISSEADDESVTNEFSHSPVEHVEHDANRVSKAKPEGDTVTESISSKIVERAIQEVVWKKDVTNLSEDERAAQVALSHLGLMGQHVDPSFWIEAILSTEEEVAKDFVAKCLKVKNVSMSDIEVQLSAEEQLSKKFVFQCISNALRTSVQIK